MFSGAQSMELDCYSEPVVSWWDTYCDMQVNDLTEQFETFLNQEGEHQRDLVRVENLLGKAQYASRDKDEQIKNIKDCLDCVRLNVNYYKSLYRDYKHWGKECEKIIKHKNNKISEIMQERETWKRRYGILRNYTMELEDQKKRAWARIEELHLMNTQIREQSTKLRQQCMRLHSENRALIDKLEVMKTSNSNLVRKIQELK